MHKSGRADKSLLVIIEASSGSLDWILPVCKYIKDHHDDIVLYFMLLRYDGEGIFNSNKTLKSIVTEISDGKCFDMGFFSPVIYRWFRRFMVTAFCFLNPITAKAVSFFDRIIWQLYSSKQALKWIRGMQGPLIILRDGIKQLSNRCGIFIKALELCKARVVAFPSAPSFTHAPSMWIKTPAGGASDAQYITDYAMVDKEWDGEYYRKYSRETAVVGTPKFDTSWINYLMSRYRNSDHEKQGEDKPIVVLLKNELSFVFKHIDFEDLLEEILDTLVASAEYKVVLKPHPRQNMELLRSIAGKYPSELVAISSDPSFQVMANAQYVISMPSGVILDALMMNIPVVEYFNYTKLNEILLSKYDSIPKNSLGGMSTLGADGHLTSIFRKNGLVIPADTPEELVYALNKVKNHEADTCIKKAQEIFYERKAEKAAAFVVKLFGVA